MHADADPAVGRTKGRRTFLCGAAAGLAGGLALYRGLDQLLDRRDAPIGPPSGSSGPEAQALGIPGPFPGRVIEVHHPGSINEIKDSQGYSQRNREAVRQMLAEGMKTLVGCDEPVDAWRRFFQPGERIGIKVVPVGEPDSISSYEVVLEVIEALGGAGIPAKDILVFERYKVGATAFMGCGYHKILPDGVQWECASTEYDEAQLEIDGQRPKEKGVARETHVSGYDRDVYRELEYCQPPPHHDPADDRRFRSHLSRIISHTVDKFISIPVLKDHRSAGITMCLKNLSHGSVNNVARSHISTRGPNDRHMEGATLNQCGPFIPAIVSLPPIRQKAVLQILDGLVGTYEGGPGRWTKSFATWQHKSLFFATDPVALDHIGWEILDQRRTEAGWSPVSKMGIDADAGIREINGRRNEESFHIRQPQHVPLAALLGLGIFERDRITYQRIELS